MKNRVNEFFSSVTPVRSDDEIITNVLRKAENMKRINTKKFSRALLIPTAAAFALAIGTIGVGAAYDWDYRAAFEAFFAGKIGSDAVWQQGDFDFEKFGKPIGETIQSENCTVTVHGIAADSTTAYLIYDIKLNELADNIDKQSFTVRTEYDMDDLSLDKNWSLNYNTQLIDINENTLSFVSSYNIDGGVLPYTPVTFYFSSLVYCTLTEDGSTGELYNIDIDESFDIPMDFEHNMAERTIPVNEDIVYKGKAATLTEISLTPFTMEYKIKYDTPIVNKDFTDYELCYYAPDNSRKALSLTDGRTVGVGSGSAKNSSDGVIAREFFSYPIDPDKVVSVTIAETEYTIE